MARFQHVSQAQTLLNLSALVICWSITDPLAAALTLPVIPHLGRLKFGAYSSLAIISLEETQDNALIWVTSSRTFRMKGEM